MLEKHKTLIIVVLVVIAVLFAQNRYQAHRERLADKQQNTNDTLQKKLDSVLTANEQKFSELEKKLTDEMNGIKTPKQAAVILQPVIGGPTPTTVSKGDLPVTVQSQLPGDLSTHYTLFTDDQMVALGKNQKQCEIDSEGRKSCEENRAVMQQKIDSLVKTNGQLQGLIVPRWSLTALVSKQVSGDYKPGVLLGYRVTKNFGLSAGAVNNALTAGVTFNFGGESKLKK